MVLCLWSRHFQSTVHCKNYTEQPPDASRGVQVCPPTCNVCFFALAGRLRGWVQGRAPATGLHERTGQRADTGPAQCRVAARGGTGHHGAGVLCP